MTGMNTVIVDVLSTHKREKRIPPQHPTNDYENQWHKKTKVHKEMEPKNSEGWREFINKVIERNNVHHIKQETYTEAEKLIKSSWNKQLEKPKSELTK